MGMHDLDFAMKTTQTESVSLSSPSYELKNRLTGMRALPDMYALCTAALGHTYQAKPECPVLQLICNTCQADRAINYPSQYKCSNWMCYICIHKIFDYGLAANTFWLRLVMINMYTGLM